jgi:glutamate-ammonia-ligase adenylyltransferase
VKYIRGGLVDIDFMVQYWQLLYAHQHPQVLQRHPLKSLEAMVALGLLSRQEGMLLTRALTLWQIMQNMLRLTLGSVSPEGNASLSLQQKLADSVGCLDFHDLRRHMDITAAGVADIFNLTFTAGDYDI